MKNVNPIVSVIIPVFRDQRIIKCLNALQKQTLSHEKFEVIIVNNDPDYDLDYGQLSNNFSVVIEPRPGSYAARNCGIRLSRGEYIVFTDADCIPSPSWLENIVSAFEDNSVDMVSGVIDIFRELNSSFFAWQYEWNTAFLQGQNFRKGVSVTANLAVRQRVFETVGLFQEQFFSGGDVEFSRRARSAGFKLVLDQKVRVSHPARKFLADIVSKRRRTVVGVYERLHGRLNKLTYLAKLLSPPIFSIPRWFERTFNPFILFLTFILHYYIRLNVFLFLVTRQRNTQQRI